MTAQPHRRAHRGLIAHLHLYELCSRLMLPGASRNYMKITGIAWGPLLSLALRVLAIGL